MDPQERQSGPHHRAAPPPNLTTTASVNDDDIERTKAMLDRLRRPRWAKPRSYPAIPEIGTTVPERISTDWARDTGVFVWRDGEAVMISLAEAGRWAA